LLNLINFDNIGAIKSVKKKHIYGGQLLEAFMKEPYESYMGFDNDLFNEGSKNKIT